MCYYSDIIGSGDILVFQILVLLAVALSIFFWAWAYGRFGIGLGRYGVPIALWMIFGTLDIVITVKGAFFDPAREGNILARLILENFGSYGGVIASAVWISIWAGFVLIINKSPLPKKLSELLSLITFYTLFVGHFFCFSSWFIPLCGFARAGSGALSWIPLLVRWFVIGLGFALVDFLHMRGYFRKREMII